MTLRLSRAPANDDELWHLLRAMWGVTLPRVSVCPDHVSPFDAVAHAYFGRDPGFAVWYASRGSGKSLALAVLGLTKGLVLDADVTILGGSMTQSLNVREHMNKLMAFPNSPTYAVRKDQATLIETWTGRKIKPLPASQTTVRGPHPPLQLLDEVDEMEKTIYDASLGQAMEQVNTHGHVINEYIVASSTWQNPIGCVDTSTPVLTRAGTVPIREVVAGDEVMTRSGWRPVLASHDTGMQECVRVSFASGAELVCTPWHPVFVPGEGFREASALTPGTDVLALALTDPLEIGVVGDALAVPDALAAPGLGEADEPDDGELVPLPAVGPVAVGVVAAEVALGGAEHAGGLTVVQMSALGVDRRGDRLEMAGVHAGPVRTGRAASAGQVGVVAEVVDVQARVDAPVQLLVDPAVRRDGDLGTAGPLDAVAVGQGHHRPADAVLGVQLDGVSTSHDQVVRVDDHGLVLPTWDLTVEGTPEYVAGGVLVHNTFTDVIDDARTKGLPIFTWCWRELLKTPANPYGWMSQRFIDNKRRAVSETMWRTEYELNEPSGASRAFDLEALEKVFAVYPTPVETSHGVDDDIWRWEEPHHAGEYYAGADWAKESDKTVIVVIRADVYPRRVVYLRRMNRRPYPQMLKAFDDERRRYNAVGRHDGTGLGNVVHDFLDTTMGEATKEIMVGRERSQLLSGYIVDVENGGYVLPRDVAEFFKAHRGATTADVYAPHKWNSHTPDDIVAMALAHKAAGRTPSPVAAQGVERSTDVRKVDSGFHAVPFADSRPDGDVVVVEERYEDVGTFWLPAGV